LSEIVNILFRKFSPSVFPNYPKLAHRLDRQQPRIGTNLITVCSPFGLTVGCPFVRDRRTSNPHNLFNPCRIARNSENRRSLQTRRRCQKGISLSGLLVRRRGTKPTMVQRREERSCAHFRIELLLDLQIPQESARRCTDWEKTSKRHAVGLLRLRTPAIQGKRA
jgi:hypothetical protein